jgi:hypothetical protein
VVSFVIQIFATSTRIAQMASSKFHDEALACPADDKQV